MSYGIVQHCRVNAKIGAALFRELLQERADDCYVAFRHVESNGEGLNASLL
jgi:hypothetical protein